MNTMTAGPPVLRSTGRCVLYLFLSFGLWGLAWVWHTSKELSAPMKGEDQSVLRTVLSVIPIANYVVLYWVWDDIDKAARQTGVGSFNTVLWLVLTIILGFPALIAYPLAQARLNAAQTAASNGTATKAPLYTFDKVTIGIGLALWALVLLIIVIAVAAG
jgi:hypothetical protein